MCKILDALHEYVPSVTEKTELISDDGETISHLDYYLICIWVYQFNHVSAQDHGTLPQLKVLINRTSVPKKPGEI